MSKIHIYKYENRNFTFLKRYTFLFLTFCTIFWGLYGWLNIPIYSATFSAFCLCVVAVFFSTHIMLQNKWRIVWKKESLLFAALLGITCIEILNTQRVVTTQSLVLTLAEAFPYVSVCFEAFVLYSLIRTSKDLRWFMRTIEKASIIIAAFSIIQFVLFPYIVIFPIDNLLFRNNLPRIYIGGGIILAIGALLSIGNVFSGRRRDKLSWLNIILVFITLGVVRQARTNTVYLLVVFFLAFVYTPYMKNTTKRMRGVLYAGILVLLILVYICIDGTSLITRVVNSDMGIMARAEGIKFFIKKFFEYPLLGMGFVTNSGNADPVSYAIFTDANGFHFHRSDVGIIGLLNMFGIVGVVWFFALLRRLGRNANALFHATGKLHGKVVFWYVTITMINLIITTFQMAMMIALVVVISDKLCEFAVVDKKLDSKQSEILRNNKCEIPERKTKQINIVLFGTTLQSDNKGCEALAYTLFYMLNTILRRHDMTAKVSSVVYLPHGQTLDRNLSAFDRIEHTFLPNRKKSLKAQLAIVNAVRQCDLCIDFTDGDSFSDIYGKSRFYWRTAEKAFVLLCGKKMLLGPQTYGPYQSAGTEKFAAWILKRAKYVYSRDEKSADLVKELTGRIIPVSTDIAFKLPKQIKERVTGQKTKIGINVSALLWNGGYTGDNQFGLTVDYRDYITRLIRWCLEEKQMQVYLIPHVITAQDENNVENDLKVCREIQTQFPQCRIIGHYDTPMMIKGYISQMDIFTGARMHSTIAAFSSGVATIPFAYSKKFGDLFGTVKYPYLIDGRSMSTEEAFVKSCVYINNAQKLTEAVQRSSVSVTARANAFFRALDTILAGESSNE